MDPIAWRQISDLLGKCVQLRPAERDVFLSSVEGAEPQVISEVRALLKVYEDDREFLESSAPSDVPRLEFPGVSANSTVSAVATGSTCSDADLILNTSNAPVSSIRRPASFWILLTLDAVVLAVYFISALLIHRYGTLTTTRGWDAQQINANWYVNEVDLHGPAATVLMIGDKVVSINSERMARVLSLDPAMSSVCPDCLYGMLVLRNGVEREFNLKKEIRQTGGTAYGNYVFLVIGLTFYVTAIFIGVLKPEQRLAQLACLSVLAEAIIFLKLIVRPFQDFPPGGLHLLYGALDLVDGLNMAVAYHFYSYFFRETARSRPWIALRYVLYSWSALVAFVRQVDRSRTEAHFWFARGGYNLVYASAPWFYLFASAAICTLIVVGYRRTREEGSTRRAKWIVVGAMVGIGPYLLVRLALSFLDATGRGHLTLTETFLLVRRLAMVPTVFIPLTTAYAILQYRAFDIHFVLRRSMQYVLARNCVRFLLSIPILGLLYTIIVNAQRTISDVIFHDAGFIGLITLLLVVLKFRSQLGDWIDRRFFRERYQQETLLVALSEQLDSLRAPSDMAEFVGKQLAAVLHPCFIAILYRDWKALFSSSYSSSAKPVSITFPDGSSVIRVLEKGNPARLVSALRNTIPKDEWQLIAGTGAELVVSMTGSGGDLSGLILLGAKQSEEPYSQYDRQLLNGIAKQMAIVHENNSLQRRLTDQRKVQHDLLTRLEIEHTPLCKECPDCGHCSEHPTEFCDRDGCKLVLSAPIERVVEQKYRLDQVIGRGGMAAVYRGMDLRLNREVAVKVVIGDKWDDRTLRRFLREARVLASLNHPNIISVYDSGVTNTDCAYLVMELLRGPTLRTIVQRRRPIPISSVADWMDQLLSGIEAAHSAGVIHRDLKPENVLISEQQHGRSLLKVLDFGIAKRTRIEPDRTSNVLTQAGDILGTVSYMSPEQLKLQEAHEQSDLFSIGIILVELLTGCNPLLGASYEERLTGSASCIQYPLGTSKEALLLDTLIRWCLADNPNDRPSSALDLRTGLIPAIVRYSHALA